MRQDVLHYYKQARQHQLDTYGSNGLHIDGVDQRQFTGGGAAYQSHALAAYWFARRQVNFRQRLKADLAAYNKRSAAAKRGWAKRRSI